jgi:hypothetical protein
MSGDSLLHRPKLFVAQHGVERSEVGVGAQHEDAVEFGVFLGLGRVDDKTLFASYTLCLHPKSGRSV